MKSSGINMDVNRKMERLKGFDDLMNELSKRTDETLLMSQSVKTDIVEAEESLLEAKQYYYQQLILINELKEISLENNYGLKDQEYEEEKSEETNVFKLLWESISEAEAKCCLNISMKGKPGENEQLFGLSTEDFEHEPRKKKILQQDIQQQCIPILERRLRDRSIELYKFWNPSNKDSEGLVVAKANQLAGAISNEKEKLKELQKDLRRYSEEYTSTYKEFYTSVSTSIQELQDKLQGVSQKPQLAGTKITSEWISARCNYILSKIRVMKNHVYGHTYNEETLQALQKVRYHLEREIKQTQADLRRTKQALFTYETIGDTFKELLKQYTQLTMEIDNKKWALSELNKNKV